jgi:5S rRNA maturation endonuclease (ribonuclease M5)
MSDFERVNRSNPCPICNKPDWCLRGSRGGILCMRVESPKPGKSGGWWHRGNSPGGPIRLLRPERPSQEIDAAAIISGWLSRTRASQLLQLANSLGVSLQSLEALHACWSIDHSAWGFPMRDGQGSVIGIRLRNDQGEKWAVKGSKQGVFLPDATPQETAMICEGPTDTAAALTLGFYALGRPSCMGGGLQLATYLPSRGVKNVIIVADDDEPGQRGAAALAKELKMPTKTWTPASKDIRKYLVDGGTRIDIEYDLRHILWTQP